MKYVSVKITPDDIRNTLKKEFEGVYEEGNKLKVPIEIKGRFDDKHIYLRKIKLLADKNKLDGSFSNKLMHELSFFRGTFDTNVNAYRVESIIPRKLFEEGRKEGYIFSVRFRSEMLEDYLDGVLIWYIREDVSK